MNPSSGQQNFNSLNRINYHHLPKPTHRFITVTSGDRSKSREMGVTTTVIRTQQHYQPLQTKRPVMVPANISLINSNGYELNDLTDYRNHKKNISIENATSINLVSPLSVLDVNHQSFEERTQRIRRNSLENVRNQVDLTGRPTENLLNLMREQLEISLKHMNEKMMESMRKNNQELIALENRLKQNEIQLMNREKQMQNLRQKFYSVLVENDQLKITIANLSQQKYQDTYQYLTGKIRDLQTKLRLITQDCEFNATQINKTVELNSKIDTLVMLVFAHQNDTLADARNTLDAYIQHIDHKYEQVQSSISKLKVQNSHFQQCVTCIHKTNDQKMQQIGKVLKTLELSNISTKKQINKEWKNRHKLVQLQVVISNLAQQIKELTNNQNEIISYVNEVEEQYSKTIVELRNNVNQMNKKNKDAPNSLHRTYSQRIKQQQKSLIRTVSKLSTHDSYGIEGEEIEYSTGDYFFNSNQRNIGNLLNDSQGIRALTKVEKLKQMLEQSNLLLPVLCQIDETGYLKYQDSSTYIYDPQGNLFELNQKELQQALKRRVIRI